MIPGSTNAALFEVTDENGDPVTGLDIADFNIFGRYLNGSGILTTWPHAATVEEDPDEPGLYWFRFTGAPASPCWKFAVTAVDPDHAIYPKRYTGDQINTDTDYLLSALSRSVALDPVSNFIGAKIPRDKGAYFGDIWNIPFTSGGLPADLSIYSDLLLSIRSLDKTTRVLDATNGVDGWGLTANALGILHIEWPDDTGTGVADIYAHLPKGESSAPPLYWEVTGKISGERYPIVQSSPLTLFPALYRP